MCYKLDYKIYVCISSGTLQWPVDSSWGVWRGKFLEDNHVIDLT